MGNEEYEIRNIHLKVEVDTALDNKVLLQRLKQRIEGLSLFYGSSLEVVEEEKQLLNRLNGHLVAIKLLKEEV